MMATRQNRTVDMQLTVITYCQATTIAYPAKTGYGGENLEELAELLDDTRKYLTKKRH